MNEAAPARSPGAVDEEEGPSVPRQPALRRRRARPGPAWPGGGPAPPAPSRRARAGPRDPAARPEREMRG